MTHKDNLIFVAHRGNISGRKVNRENEPSYLQEALKLGFAVEIDVRYYLGKIFFGHDYPQYEVDLDQAPWRDNLSVFYHCKDIQTLDYFTQHQKCSCFFYQDGPGITTIANGFGIGGEPLHWSYKYYVRNGITMIDYPGDAICRYDVAGFCSDEILVVREQTRKRW